jgi:hypothetical protein
VREIRLLRHFRHENVICISDLFTPASQRDDFHDVYIVSDLMETDLHRVIYSRQQLTDEHVQFYLYQLLCALKCVWRAPPPPLPLVLSFVLFRSLSFSFRCCNPVASFSRFPLPPIANMQNHIHHRTIDGVRWRRRAGSRRRWRRVALSSARAPSFHAAPRSGRRAAILTRAAVLASATNHHRAPRRRASPRQVHPLGARAPPRHQAVQHLAQRELRPQG